jgi:hypothetical protein
VPPDQGSILRNSISAENVSDKLIFILKIWTNVYPKKNRLMYLRISVTRSGEFSPIG